MSSITINRILNANLYAGNNSLLGRAEEIQLPAIKAKDTDVNVLGLHAAVKLPGGIEAMTGKIKFNAVYPELIALFSNPYKAQQIQARANMQVYDSTGLINEKSVVAYLTVRFKDVLPAITFKMNDNPEQESEFNCSYYRLEIDDERMVEIDAFTNVFFIKDEDVLAKYRTNLGF